MLIGRRYRYIAQRGDLEFPVLFQIAQHGGLSEIDKIFASGIEALRQVVVRVIRIFRSSNVLISEAGEKRFQPRKALLVWVVQGMAIHASGFAGEQGQAHQAGPPPHELSIERPD